MYVYYNNERWKIIHQPVRDSLMFDLKKSCPNKIIIIQNYSNLNKEKRVALKDVTLDL